MDGASFWELMTRLLLGKRAATVALWTGLYVALVLLLDGPGDKALGRDGYLGVLVVSGLGALGTMALWAKLRTLATTQGEPASAGSASGGTAERDDHDEPKSDK